ncbi:MAG: hypothetical protein J0I02_05205, partial [Alphaproteobacteria bacterium]|nr:hypothetical protein [Alphaproteobacteria bacterium]
EIVFEHKREGDFGEGMLQRSHHPSSKFASQRLQISILPQGEDRTQPYLPRHDPDKNRSGAVQLNPTIVAQSADPPNRAKHRIRERTVSP